MTRQAIESQETWQLISTSGPLSLIIKEIGDGSLYFNSASQDSTAQVIGPADAPLNKPLAKEDDAPLYMRSGNTTRPWKIILITGEESFLSDPSASNIAKIVDGSMPFSLAGLGGNSCFIGLFGEQLAEGKEDDITVQFQYGLNEQFDIDPPIITGDGDADTNGSLARVSSVETGTATIPSKAAIRYHSGKTGFAYFTARFSGSGTGEAGPHDDDDGFVLRVSNGVASIFYLKSGVPTDISTQGEFNGNANLANIEWDKVNIFLVLFGYLGVADISFFIKKRTWQLLHTIETEGELESTHVDNPVFPIRIKATDGATVESGSWNGGVFGTRGVVGTRTFIYTRNITLSAASLSTVVTLSSLEMFGGRANKVRWRVVAVISSIDTPSSGDGTVELNVYRNATLLGTPTPVDIDTGQSTISSDIVRTYDSGGHLVFRDWEKYSSQGADKTSDPATILPVGALSEPNSPSDEITLTLQNVAGDTNVTIRNTIIVRELF